MRLWTLLPALLLAAAIPTGAQTLDYETLCGATEGTGDNNDFCTLWAQRNYQGMRNALSIAIRTARAAENRNRYYFDHKRGAERGAFIQLKRDWMGDEWQVRQGSSSGSVLIFNRDRDLTLAVDLVQSPQTGSWEGKPPRDDSGYSLVDVAEWIDQEPRRRRLWGACTKHYQWCGEEDVHERYGEDAFPSDFVRRIVECKIDEYGWSFGEVEVRPDCEGIED